MIYLTHWVLKYNRKRHLVCAFKIFARWWRYISPKFLHPTSERTAPKKARGASISQSTHPQDTNVAHCSVWYFCADGINPGNACGGVGIDEYDILLVKLKFSPFWALNSRLTGLMLISLWENAQLAACRRGGRIKELRRRKNSTRLMGPSHLLKDSGRLYSKHKARYV